MQRRLESLAIGLMLLVACLAELVLKLRRAGYVHGRHPEICPNKCRPDPQAGYGESPKQTLIREALEFQVCLYYPMTDTRCLSRCMDVNNVTCDSAGE